MDAKLEMNVDKLAEQHPRERRLYYALDDDGDGRVLKEDIDQALRSVGLARTDSPRLAQVAVRMIRGTRICRRGVCCEADEPIPKSRSINERKIFT